jgi:glutamate carboxypeptidase
MTPTPLPNQLQTFFEENLPTYLEYLAQMVNVNSFTSNPAGVNQLGQLTAEIFAPLGFSAEFTPSANPLFGRHLALSRLSGTAGGPTIGLVSHLDTVFPPEEEQRNNFAWRVAGERIYGPGTVDIKGGTLLIYMVLAALEQFAPETFQNTNWHILLNAGEEELTPDFSQLCYQTLPAETLACLVFEAGHWDDDCFNLVVARKGRATYHIEVEGRGAHAGSTHERGANAVVQMARIIDRVAALTDHNRHLTFNIGTVTGGTVINRVPHRAVATGEMRAFDPETFAEGVGRLLALQDEITVTSLEDNYACRVKINVLHESVPWAKNPATDQLFTLWQETAASLGWQTVPEARGGLSDGNFTWNHFPTLDGLGPAGDNAHCSECSPDGSKDQEYVQVTSFVPKAVLNTLAILNLLS